MTPWVPVSIAMFCAPAAAAMIDARLSSTSTRSSELSSTIECLGGSAGGGAGRTLPVTGDRAMNPGYTSRANGHRRREILNE